MSDTLHDALWLTHAARDRLQAELDLLAGQSAPSSAVEGRMAELRATLRRTEVGDKPDDGLVEAGMTVTVIFDGDPTEVTFLLAQRAITQADSAVGIDIYSPTSPLGTAIASRYPGDRFRYVTPSGTEVGGQIVAAVPFHSSVAP